MKNHIKPLIVSVTSRKHSGQSRKYFYLLYFRTVTLMRPRKHLNDDISTQFFSIFIKNLWKISLNHSQHLSHQADTRINGPTSFLIIFRDRNAHETEKAYAWQSPANISDKLLKILCKIVPKSSEYLALWTVSDIAMMSTYTVRKYTIQKYCTKSPG